VERIDDFPPGLKVEVDDDIATKDEIHTAEQRHPVGIEQVQVTDGDQFPHLVADPELAILLLK